jgi:hypothetical protein
MDCKMSRGSWDSGSQEPGIVMPNYVQLKYFRFIPIEENQRFTEVRQLTVHMFWKIIKYKTSQKYSF